MVKEEKKSLKGLSSGIDQGTLRYFRDAFYNYVRALNDVQIGIQKRSMEVYNNKYAKVLNEAQADAQKRSEEAYRNMLNKIKEIWGQEDTQSRYREVYQDYMVALQEVQSRLQKSYEEAYRNYTESMQPVSEDVQKLYMEPYRNYLSELQKTWSQLDINAVDANTLAGIGQIMITTSLYASATLTC
jgi:hypothetical protein